MSFFENLNATISSHAAWNNGFFRKADEISLAQLRRVAPEYLYFTSEFPSILAQLIARVDLRAQFHLVEILHSELGSGKEPKSHANLFRRLCRDIGVLHGALNAPPRLAATKALTTGLRKLYGKEPLAGSLGAQYALEYQADHMLKSFRVAFADVDLKKTQGMAFFKVHEKEEPEHIDAMKRIMARYLQEDLDTKEALNGAKACLNLFACFWEELLADVERGKGARPGSGRGAKGPARALLMGAAAQ